MRHQHTTPVPNAIFDRYLRELKGAELKVLLIIIRQTLGWQDRRSMYGRKERDWISRNQLILKTGMSDRAITGAISTLVKRKLIEVQSERGYLLGDPCFRRGKMKLFYNLHPDAFKSVDNWQIHGYIMTPTSAKIAEHFRSFCG